MPTICDDAVCIRRWDFSETSQTVSLFTREHGVIRGLAKGAKRERGAFSGGLDVLTRGQIVAIVKPGRDLATLTQWSLQAVYRAIRTDLRANRAGLYMADLIHHMVTEADPHPALFDALTTALGRLEECGGRDPHGSSPMAHDSLVDEALLHFQWTLLLETGYRPELGTGGGLDPEGVLFFSPGSGGIVSAGAADRGGSQRSWRVRRETIELLRRVERGEAAGDPPLGVDSKTVERANRLLAAYVREVLGSEPATMQWAFPGLSTG